MSKAKLASIICLSSGVQSLTSGFEPKWLAEKALEVAEACLHHEDPEAMAILYGSTFGGSINSVTVEGMVFNLLAVDAKLKSPAVVGLLELVGGETIADRWNAMDDDLVEAIRAGVTKDVTEKVTKLAAEQHELAVAELTKRLADAEHQLKQRTEALPSSEIKVDAAVEEAIKVAETESNAVGDVLVTDLAITSKQKSVLHSAGLTTTKEVIEYHVLHGLAAVNGIGPNGAAHILSVIGYKE